MPARNIENLSLQLLLADKHREPHAAEHSEAVRIAEHVMQQRFRMTAFVPALQQLRDSGDAQRNLCSNVSARGSYK
jgi:hypothetical protein